VALSRSRSRFPEACDAGELVDDGEDQRQGSATRRPLVLDHAVPVVYEGDQLPKCASNLRRFGGDRRRSGDARRQLDLLPVGIPAGHGEVVRLDRRRSPGR
jgi:hypothetical protein